MGEATGDRHDDQESPGDPDGQEPRGGVAVDGSGTGLRPGVAVDPDANGPAAFMQVLRVPRNAKWGAAVGLAFTLAVFVFFVVIPGTYRSPLWYVGLGFVLALSTAGLVAFLLTLVRAIRLSRSL